MKLAQDKDSRSYENLLSLLEGLLRFPRTQSDINAWLVEEVGAKPPKPKVTKKGAAEKDGDEDDEPLRDADEDEAEDDWRKFFDEPEENAKSTKSTPSVRLNRLTVHQSLHSLPSHRAVFTRAWLGLLPHLSDPQYKDGALASRAWNIMHQSVMPHLTRAVMVMDWVGSCVDYGMPP